ncbi:hypothetical protein J7376_19665 [Paracoccus sp. R12_1]|uniref:hypothetical protein n=1 Tax=unclassified Paracoccus (in: a-proteobacteria) TaxID=2688777 RepID=UPI001AD99EDF|nr:MULTISPECIES: hypothetical protein [unclassified Paracoccus (in: a-proteobacteria)]MBO9457311.1 hypothetical protein [Paracoccus sp. R12_2]MBO9488721.1 hypothetical protein [Paracoccus sp. R12_1]
MNNLRIKTQPSSGARQKSHHDQFDGRGRSRGSARRAHVHGQHPDRADFLRRWSLLMIASFRSSEVCAAHFDVTMQTAWNWREGINCPLGHHVDHAHATLARFDEIMRGDR